MKSRNRITYGAYLLGLICLGLVSRSTVGISISPLWIGDLLYAVAAYLFIAILFHRLRPQHLAISTLIFCFTIELSQLIQTDWMNAVRAIKYSKLLLGSGFLWSDLLAYTCGTALIYLFEKQTTKSL